MLPRSCRICLGLLILALIIGSASPIAAQQSPPESTANSAPAQPGLAAELLRRMEQDQQARLLFVELKRHDPGPVRPGGKLAQEQAAVVAKVQAIDEQNRVWLSETIRQVGWPGKSLVGEQAAHAAWLLVQHADAAPDFQEQCLEKMKAAAPGEVAPVDIAYLTDRVLINRGRPQVYGTQCVEVAGSFGPLECIEPDALDRRRQEVGLQPMKEYLQQMKEMYRDRQDQPKQGK